MTNDSMDAAARELLRAVVTGDRDPEDPEVRARCERDPAFARRLAELRATAETLERTAAEARAVRQAAAELQGAPGEARLARVLDGRGRGPGLSRFLWFGAAAAGIAVALVLGRGERENDGEPLWMGEETVRLRHPRGLVTDYSPIRWDGHLPRRGEYRITIEGEAAANPAGPTFLEHRTTETQWTPPAEDLSRLGARIRVDVSVFVDGQRIDGDSSEAWH